MPSTTTKQQKHLSTLSKESYLKNEWCSTEHFHRCLQAFSFLKRNTKVCSCKQQLQKTLWNRFPWKWLKTCSCPSSSSSTTTRVSFFFLKSNLVILGQKKSPTSNEIQNEVSVISWKWKWRIAWELMKVKVSPHQFLFPLQRPRCRLEWDPSCKRSL